MNANEIKTYWITKYALTQGIYTIQGQVTSIPTMIEDVNKSWTGIYHKPYWCETPEEAIKHAELMRLKKFESINKTIAKLKKLDFKKQVKKILDNNKEDS